MLVGEQLVGIVDQPEMVGVGQLDRATLEGGINPADLEPAIRRTVVDKAEMEVTATLDDVDHLFERVFVTPKIRCTIGWLHIEPLSYRGGKIVQQLSIFVHT